MLASTTELLQLASHLRFGRSLVRMPRITLVMCTSLTYVPLNIAKHLSIAKDFSKVYVEHVARPLDHDVVIMPVTDAQYVCCHTVASTRVRKILHCLQKSTEM